MNHPGLWGETGTEESLLTPISLELQVSLYITGCGMCVACFQLTFVSVTRAVS